MNGSVQVSKRVDELERRLLLLENDKDRLELEKEHPNMSGILKDNTTVLAGTTVDNLLTGSKFDYLPGPSVITFYAVQEQVSGSLLICDFTLGNVIVGDNLSPNIAAMLVGPKINEDVIAKGSGIGGDRVQIRVRETVGGAGDDGILRWQVVIEDVL